MRHWYRVLQVDPNADPAVIDAAFRSLARKHHPDVSKDPHAGERMRELNRVLRDDLQGRLSLVGPSYSGVGVNDCVRSAREAAYRVAKGNGATGLERLA